MTTTLTDQEIEDLRADIGDVGAEPAFEKPELNRLYVRAGYDYNTTVVLALRQLYAQTWRLADYKQNQSEEKRSQIMSNLKKLLDHWESIVDAAKPQVKVYGRRSIPPVRRNVPRA